VSGQTIADGEGRRTSQFCPDRPGECR
jgi:hypothetical protein